MDKCPKCGIGVLWTDDRKGLSTVGFRCLTYITAMLSTAESKDCLRRQLAAAKALDSARLSDIKGLSEELAAANERAGGLEAQMVELREAWRTFTFNDGDEKEWTIIDRILGGS